MNREHSATRLLSSSLLFGCAALAGLIGCTGALGTEDPNPNPNPAGGTGGTPGVSGTGSTTGSGGSIGGGGTGGGNVVGGTGGMAVAGSGGATQIACNGITPGRAPLRRLTTYEFNNTVRDLLADTTNPGNDLASESSGKGFGNDADLQSVSDLMAEKFASVAQGIATRATANAAALGRLHTCASTVTAANEEACARMIVNSVVPRAFRRTITTTEADQFVAFYRAVRAQSTTLTFASGVAAVLEATLQDPEFLYRIEFGAAVSGNTSVKRLTGRELATRLSYLYWQTMPDAALFQAADSGALDTAQGVLTQARAMVNNEKARPALAYYFDNLLPITDLANLERAQNLFPTFSASIGTSMRQEVQRVIEHEVFENTTQAPGSPYAAGSWPAALTAPYTFVNQALFNYYGASAFAAGTTVTGTALQKVNLNTSQRLGLLTLGGIMAGTATTNLTNPVLRGGFVVHKLMCRNIPLPTGPAAMNIKPPEPYTGKTARERYSAHSADPACGLCHQYMDPLGLALENYDAVGLYRTHEVNTIEGVTYTTQINAAGSVPGVQGAANGPVELVRLLASSGEVQACLGTHWLEFGYGRMLDAQDACNEQSLQNAYRGAGYNIKELLVALSQTDGFQFRPAQ